MDKLRQIIAQIQAYLKDLTATQKLLIASLAVIVAMSMFLMLQYTSQPTMVELMADDPQQPIVANLRAAGFEVETKDGKVLVAPSERTAAIAHLSQAGALPDDSTLLFNNLTGAQDWRNSAAKDHEQYIFALQNELGRIISKFRGVKDAKVIIHAPEGGGLGRAARPPTASVTIFTSSGTALSQATVDAAARLVAGARSGLEVANVQVIDGTTGRPRKATAEDELVSSSYLEHQAMVERETREKLEGLLSYIPGVVVAVTAQVDIARVNSEIEKHLNKGEGTVTLPKRSETMTMSQTDSSQSAEPGIRSNATADINQGPSQSGTKVEQEQTTDEFESAIGTEITHMVDPRGMATSIVASINVPEGYVQQLLEAEKGTGSDPNAKPPTHDELVTKFVEIQKQISASVQPHLKTQLDDGTIVPGEVQVTMVPVAIQAPVPGATSEAGFLSVLGGGSPATLAEGFIDKIVLGALAVFAVGMMLMMIKRSGRKIELPSVSELVGVPPSLNVEGDVIGEAEEGDAPMAGIEVDDEDVRSQKMLDQVTELVDQSPDGAANLLRRWIQIEE